MLERVTSGKEAQVPGIDTAIVFVRSESFCYFPGANVTPHRHPAHSGLVQTLFQTPHELAHGRALRVRKSCKPDHVVEEGATKTWDPEEIGVGAERGYFLADRIRTENEKVRPFRDLSANVGEEKRADGLPFRQQHGDSWPLGCLPRRQRAQPLQPETLQLPPYALILVWF